MADKEEDKTEAREDAMLDKVLTRLDAVMSRMDAMEERAEKDRKDAAEADEKAKADAAAEEEKAKADAAKKDDDDKPGEPEQVAADKAAKDADEAEKAKADADAEEKAAKDTQDTRERIAGMERTIETLRAGRPEADAAKIAQIRERADTVFQAFGDSAPAPWADETEAAYRRRLAGKLQIHSERAKDVKLTAIHDETGFKVFEDIIYHDAAAAARNPVDLPYGKLREVVTTDRNTGVRTTTFVGKGTFIGQMKRPGQRARLVLDQRARG